MEWSKGSCGHFTVHEHVLVSRAIPDRDLPVPVWVWHTTQECGRGDGRCVTGWFDGQAEGRWYERPGCAGLWRMIRFAGTGGTNHHYMAIRAQHLRKREDGDQRPGDVPG